ncbi:MAG: LamG domain-containing protein, partial [Verrucomicrobiota bacterium]
MSIKTTKALLGILTISLALRADTLYSSSFDTVAAGDYGLSNALLPAILGPSVEQWTVLTNDVAVVAGSGLCTAYEGGTNYLALANGQIAEVTSTVVGLPYSLTYACRGPGLVDWWPFDGDAEDIIGTNNGAVTSVTAVPCEVALGFQFNGISSQIDFGPSAGNVGTNDFTIDWWMNTTNSFFQAFMAKRGACDWTSSLVVNIVPASTSAPFLPAGCLQFGLMDGIYSTPISSYLSTVTSVADGQWHHVAWERRADTAGGTATEKVYVDGQLNNTGSDSTVYSVINSSDLVLGNNVCVGVDGENHYSGAVDELDIWNRALSDVEIAAIYEAGTQGKKGGSSYILPNCQILVNGATNSTVIVPASGTNWLTNGVYFTAVSDTTTVVIQGNPLGMLFDDFVWQPPITPIPNCATATPEVINGFVVGATITDGGSGYTNTPTVRIIGNGGGSGAQAVAVVSNGVVIAIDVQDAGSNYTSAALVVIDPPFISSPVLGGSPMSFLTFSNLTVGGVYQLQQAVAWYWTNQPVNFTATNSVYTQMVSGVTTGGDYRLALNPVPSQAFALPEVVNEFVVGATVTNGGSGYLTNPPVSIVGGGGSNATAVSKISSGGVVTNITITDAGNDYSSTPIVEIGQPPAAAVSPTVLPVLRLDSASLAPYDNYQIQFTPALGEPWGNWDEGVFTPTAVTNSQYLFMTNGPGFIRLEYLPPQQDFSIPSIAANGWYYGFVDLPNDATNLLIQVGFNNGGPLGIFLDNADDVSTNDYGVTPIIPPGGQLDGPSTNLDIPLPPVTVTNMPAITGGRWYYGIYNENPLVAVTNVNVAITITENLTHLPVPS